MSVGQSDMIWHQDGHKVSLMLTRANLLISTVSCPDAKGECHNERVGCVVTWFLMRYGLDCHVGQASPMPELEIAWTLVGDQFDIEACQVWVISIDDPLYGSWAVSQSD
jgi:hypothetical protein